MGTGFLTLERDINTRVIMIELRFPPGGSHTVQQSAGRLLAEVV